MSHYFSLRCLTSLALRSHLDHFITCFKVFAVATCQIWGHDLYTCMLKVGVKVIVTWIIIYCIASNYGLGVYFFPATFTPATKQDWWLYQTGVYFIVEVLNQIFQAMNSNGCWDSRVADPVDIVHHEMDSAVHYTPVWSLEIEQFILEKEPAGRSTWWICSTWQW